MRVCTQCIRSGAITKRIQQRPVQACRKAAAKQSSHVAMAISREEVEKVSLLGRLLLSEEELDTMTSQMGDILGYMELLAEVDTEQVEPMAHALDVANVFRDDAGRGRASIANEALANAPHRDGECYLVPAVLGEVTIDRASAGIMTDADSTRSTGHSNCSAATRLRAKSLRSS